MTVNWEEPETDGGSPITGYWLERKETTSKRWNRVTRDPIRPMPLGVSHNVTGLIEGSQYIFRVTAINAAGCGLPSLPSDPMFAREAIGTKSAKFHKHFKIEVIDVIFTLCVCDFLVCSSTFTTDT